MPGGAGDLPDAVATACGGGRLFDNVMSTRWKRDEDFEVGSGLHIYYYGIICVKLFNNEVIFNH